MVIVTLIIPDAMQMKVRSHSPLNGSAVKHTAERPVIVRHDWIRPTYVLPGIKINC